MLLKVLLIENPPSSETVSVEDDLIQQGCNVLLEHNPNQACPVSDTEWPDLVVVNACNDLPDVDRICDQLDEADNDFPRLIVSDDKTHNHLPADAHLLVPFSSRQISHRIRKATSTQPDRFLRVGNVTLDKLKNRLKCCDHTARLTPKELRLLQFLMERPGEVQERRIIMRDVWETDYVGDTRTLEVHIRWIRKKLEPDPKRPEHILTVRGQGYVFQVVGKDDESEI